MSFQQLTRFAQLVTRAARAAPEVQQAQTAIVVILLVQRLIIILFQELAQVPAHRKLSFLMRQKGCAVNVTASAYPARER